MNKGGRGNCRICSSPLRGEIEYLVKQKIPLPDIAKKYYQAFDIKEVSFYMKLINHVKRKHPPLLNLEPVTENKAHTFNEYAQGLLEVGMNPLLMSPGQVKHSHVIAAHNALVNEEKVRGQVDAQKMAFIKFMRGSAIEGEVVDEEVLKIDAKLAGAEDVPTHSK